MQIDLQKELDLFHSYTERKWHSFEVSVEGPSVFKLTPKQKTPEKTLNLGFLALVHGDEILGLSVLNSLLDGLYRDEIQTDCALYFGLGNIPAAKENKRFIEEDLNRAFNLTSQGSHEARRARELETCFLNHCDYLIDLHQTGEEALNAFFIFQYSSPRCLNFIRRINSDVPTIVQFDTIGGECSGLASDEYVRLKGGFGTTLELGKAGPSEKYFEVGFKICKQTIETLTATKNFSHLEFEGTSELSFPLYKIATVARAENPGSQLKAGWQNLQYVTEGEIIGQCGEFEIRAPHAGALVFPQYKKEIKVGQSLFHLMTPIGLSELL